MILMFDLTYFYGGWVADAEPETEIDEDSPAWRVAEGWYLTLDGELLPA